MLTVEQVKNNSQVYIGGDKSSQGCSFNRSIAQFRYLNNGHACRLKATCKFPKAISLMTGIFSSKEDIKTTIDWKRFTNAINKYIALTEENIVSVGQWLDALNKNYKEGKTEAVRELEL